jgi:hypothetical protein
MSESPSTWKYVGVWLLAGFLGKIASVVLSSIGKYLKYGQHVEWFAKFTGPLE